MPDGAVLQLPVDSDSVRQGSYSVQVAQSFPKEDQDEVSVMADAPRRQSTNTPMSPAAVVRGSNLARRSVVVHSELEA